MSEDEQSPNQEPKPSGFTSFWNELKRRKVVRVGIVYAVVAWLLIQVSATVFPQVGLPDWTSVFVTWILIIGFPIALIFAWVFEVTPEGIKADSEMRSGQGVAPAKGQKLHYITLGLVVLVLTFLIVDRYLFDASRASVAPSTVLTIGDRSALASTIQLTDTALLGFGMTSIGPDNQLISLSPNGAWLVYVGGDHTSSRLYKKRLTNFEHPEPLPGTEGAIFSCFSPDGQMICFLTGDRLKRVSIDGDNLTTMATTNAAVRAHWTETDWIYLADEEGFTLRRIQIAAGEVQTLYNSRLRDRVSLRFTYVFPDGRSALAMDDRQSISSDYRSIVLVDLRTGDFKHLKVIGYDPRWVSSGHLVFGRSKNLAAICFDREQGSVVGEPFAVLTGVAMSSNDGYMQLAVSTGGTLAYVPGTDRAIGNIVAISRQGSERIFANIPTQRYGPLDLRKDNGALAIHVADVSDYIFIYDLKREEGRKLAGSDDYGWPRWNSIGNRLALTSYFNSQLETKFLDFSIDDAEAQLVYSSSEERVAISDWSPNGEEFAVHGTGKIGFVSSDGESIVHWVAKPHSGLEFLPVFSPDGQWIAYSSSESGRTEVWIRPHPDGTVRRQVSVNGGIEPVWSECGEIFFRRGNQVWSSTVQLEPELRLGPEQHAFTAIDFQDTPAISYDISSDGQTMYYVKSGEPVVDDRIHVVGNWLEELKDLVPTN